MNERVVQFRVGVMVLATALIAGILILLFGEAPTLFRGHKTVFILFPQAPGVTAQTPVRKSGILIGRVTDVQFADDGQVLVTTEIDPQVKLRENEVPRISGSLLGDAVIQFVLSAKPVKPDAMIEDGELLSGEVASDPLQVVANLEGKLNQAITSLGGAGDEVSQLARNINNLLAQNDEQIHRIIGRTEGALQSFQTAMDNVNHVIGDEKTREDLRRSLGDLPGMLDETKRTITSMRTTVESADRNLKNLEGFTGPLGQRGDKLIANVDQSVQRLDELLEQMVRFGTALNSREGSLGQLLNNPDVYQHLNAAAENVEQLTRELRPIVCDIRVFTDQVARHPGVILRDAVRPGPGIK